jgi:hypothetical protein
MGGGGDSNTVTKADPWGGVQPYLVGQPAREAGQPTQGVDYQGNPTTIPGTPAQSAVTGILPEAARIYNDVNPQYYPGSTVAQFTPEQQAAQALTTNRALSGSQNLQSAEANNAATNRGDYLNSNPGMSLFNSTANGNFLNSNPSLNYLKPTANGDYLYGGQGFNAAFDAASRKIIPQIDSQFAGAGRLNSGLAGVAKSQALGDTFAGMYGQERQNQLSAANSIGNAYAQERGNQLSASSQIGNMYDSERQRQQQANVLAPQLANADYNDFNQLNQVGGQKQSQGQMNIQDLVDRFNFNQNVPYQKLAAYAGLLSPLLGVGGQQTTPFFSNTLGQVAGAGLAGSQIYRNMGMGAGTAGTTDAGILASSGVGAGVGGMSFADALAAGMMAM